MVTIAGSGMGEYNFNNINLDFSSYDMVFCDQNFQSEIPNVVKGSFKATKEAIFENLDKDILYVVTGSPLFFSGALVILPQLKREKIQFKIIDNSSSLGYMLSFCGVSMMSTNTISLHGKSGIDLSSFLTKKYTFVVCDEHTPKRLKEATKYLSTDDITITLGEQFGYSGERFSTTTIDEMLSTPPTMPYSLLIQQNYKLPPTISSEDTIEHENGMITKSYKRHISLQNLELSPNLLLWDIGAGSGSVSIDGYKRYHIKSILFEKNIKRAEMIERSLSLHRVVDTKLYIGEASRLYKEESSTPDRIFVGGGGNMVIKELDYLYNRLKDGGIMVANFVTLEHLSTAIGVLKEADIPFEIKSISLTTYKLSLLLPNPERIMHQIVIKKSL
jgi:precorrin-6Y C5,15-methyltransferase (decarboxylating)